METIELLVRNIIMDYMNSQYLLQDLTGCIS